MRHIVIRLLATGLLAAAVVGCGSSDSAEPSSTQPEPATTSSVSPTTQTTATPASTVPPIPEIEIYAPTGRFNTTHLLTVLTGQVTPGAIVTIDGEPASIAVDTTDGSLGASFHDRRWFVSGENTVVVEAHLGDETTTTELVVWALPRRANEFGYISTLPTDTIAKTVRFDPADATPVAESLTRVVPPAEWMIGTSREPQPGEWIVANDTTETVDYWVDAMAVVVIRTDHEWTSISYDDFRSMWNDPAFAEAVVQTPAWLTVLHAEWSGQPLVEQIYLDLRAHHP